MTSTLRDDLDLRDLTDPRTGPHALQQMIEEILRAVTARYRGDLRLERGERIVQVTDNYDRLGYGADARARDKRYTRYVDDTRMLRSQTSALIPPALRRLAAEPATTWPPRSPAPGRVIDAEHPGLVAGGNAAGPVAGGNAAGPVAGGNAAGPVAGADAATWSVTIACPGLVYRRDVIDRLHTGTPHQLDLWHLTTIAGGNSRDELLGLLGTVLGAALPGVRWRVDEAVHPYTEDGLEIEAWAGGEWVEVGECGRAGRRVLAGAGLPAYVSGLALGLGLDRLVMLRKGVPDIRLLRSADPRVAGQMLDLEPWWPVSAYPAARRDVSVAMRAGVTAEEVGDLVRESLGGDAGLIEEIAIRSITSPPDLPAVARERLGIGPDEVNVLLRVVLRDLDGTIPGELANDLRDRIYAALHHA